MEGIEPAIVEHIAQLSRLTLTEEEVSRYTQQLSAILEYASHLPELSDQGQDSPMRMSDDVIIACELPENLLQNAVAIDNGSVKVPAILDKGETV